MTRLKHWLIASQHNEYHPHALRWPFLVYVFSLVVFSQLLWNIAHTGNARVLGFATDINAGRVVELTNAERTKQHLPALAENPILNQAAQAKANDMLTKHYWAHVSPSGQTPWSFIHAVGYTYDYAGENLAMDFSTSAGVLGGWMASPEHRANILDTNYKEIGVAVVNGQLEGQDTTLIVAMYAAPQASIIDSAITAAVPGVKAASVSAEAVPQPHAVTVWQPVVLAQAMPWPVMVTILVFSALLLLYVNDHRLKLSLKVSNNHHSHSLLQAVLLAVTIGLVVLKLSHGLVG